MEGGVVLRGRYQLLRLLGRGGMAEVYLATDTIRQTEVAVKVLREDLAEDPQFLHRFQREAEALSRLDHPNVVRFYSFERQGSTAFIVMDYVPGTTLRGRLAEAGGALSIEEITSVLGQVTSALYYAHSQGYVHRDIKPGNVMLRPDGTALLSDLGIARATEASTMTQAPLGTPAYMSPEQILGRPVDGRCDIYALGVVLYEMATGQRPFSGTMGTGTSTVERVRDEHLHMLPPDPRRLNPALPEGAARVILKALAKEPGERWTDSVSMMRAWQQAVEHETRLSATRVPLAAVPSRTLAPASRQATPAAVATQQRVGGAGQAAAARQSTKSRRGCIIWGALAGLAALIVGAAICAVLAPRIIGSLSTPTPPPTAVSLEPTPTSATTTRQPTSTRQPSTATSTPDRSSIVLRADGSGDYAGLADAVAAAPIGATIKLGPGTYTLDAPLIVKSDLALIGSGADRTVVTSRAEDSVLTVSIEGLFTAQGIAFRHEGGAAANVVVVEAGRAEFQDCAFAGAVWDAEAAHGGSGVLFIYSSTGVVRRSHAEGNGLYGIELVGSTYAEIDASVASFNAGGGISLWASASADISGNTCSSNGYHGIAINGSATANLVGNSCEDNQYSGISYVGEGGGTASENLCSYNGYHGIAVEGNARPTLLGNVCTGNTYSGISYFGSAAGVARGNQLSENLYHGIGVNGSSTPRLEDNRCFDNGIHGIGVYEDAAPVIEKNTLTGNSDSGIAILNNARATASGNTCSGNGLHGIAIGDTAAPDLAANACFKNSDSGIAYFGTSAGTASGNECYGNRSYGIYVDSTADPVLSDNRSHDNDTQDVFDKRR